MTNAIDVLRRTSLAGPAEPTKLQTIVEGIAAVLRAVSARGADTLGALLESVRTLFGGDRETRRRVAFSVAMIALSAKMAKADGVVSTAEVAAFRRIFDIPPDEMRNVFRLYDLARQDTAGFEAYAEQMTHLCAEGEKHCRLLGDVLDGLFHIAKADGVVHERELEFLHRIATVFGLSEAEFKAVEFRHVTHGEAGDFAILGLARDAALPKVRERYLELVRENHPDKLIARGVPAEFMTIGTERMKAINAAYQNIAKARAA